MIRRRSFDRPVGLVFAFGSLALIVASSWVAKPAGAIPAFARKEGQNCGFCHTAYPKLNEQGRTYKANGFRFPDVPGNNIWEEKSGVPLSVVAELEAFLDHVERNDGTSNTTGPDGKVDEIEIMGAGTLSNRASFFAEVEFDEDADAELGQIWAQVNDLYGPMGAVNARVGQFDVDFPFLSEGRRVIRNKYLAFDRMGFFDSHFGGEVNGQILGDPDEGELTHRYAVGIVRGGSDDDDNKFTKGYATYSKNWGEVHNVGLMVMGGQEEDVDPMTTAVFEFDTVGVGLAGQTECGKWTFTGGYFFEYQGIANAFGGDQQLHNVMTEALYMPNDDWVVGGRLDWLVETERARSQDWGFRGSFLVRYNVVWNVWVGAEYRGENGGVGNPVTPLNDSTHKGRLFTFFAF